MNFVYVLVSSEKDIIAEQAFVSIYTLKKHNPGAYVVLVTDEETSLGLTGGRGRVKNCVDKIITKKLPQGLSKTQRSRYLKTSLPKYLEDDFLYIDNDTIVSGSLVGLEAFDGEIGAVYNRHQNTWDVKYPHPMLCDNRKKTGIKASQDLEITKCYNGGILLCKNTDKTKTFFDTWHKLWLKSSIEFRYHKDQPDLWRANVLNGNLIKAIDGIYNCQLIYPNNAKKYFFNCKIIHYFSSSKSIKWNIRLNKRDYMLNIRENGITEDVDAYLNNFMTEYMEEVEIIIGHDIDLYHSPFCIMSKRLIRICPFLNVFSRWLYRCFGYKI